MIRKYHNHKPQTTPCHHKEEPLNHHETPGRQIKQSNQLSLPHQDDCNTRMDINWHTTKHRAITDSYNGSTIKQKLKNNRTTAPERTAAQATGAPKCIPLVPNLSTRFSRCWITKIFEFCVRSKSSEPFGWISLNFTQIFLSVSWCQIPWLSYAKSKSHFKVMGLCGLGYCCPSDCCLVVEEKRKNLGIDTIKYQTCTNLLTFTVCFLSCCCALLLFYPFVL